MYIFSSLFIFSFDDDDVYLTSTKRLTKLSNVFSIESLDLLFFNGLDLNHPSRFLLLPALARSLHKSLR